MDSGKSHGSIKVGLFPYVPNNFGSTLFGDLNRDILKQGNRKWEKNTYTHNIIQVFNGEGDVFHPVSVFGDVVTKFVVIWLISGDEDKVNLKMFVIL